MANQLAPAVLLLTAGLACSGCVALWQDDHKVEANTGWAVTIEYDPLLSAPERLTSTAQSECGKFQRVAVLDHVRKGLTWTRIADFRCENAPAYLKGSIASLPPEEPVAKPSYRSLPSPFPAVMPRVASAPAVPQVAASPAAAPKVASVRIINASGVTRRQIAKPQIAQPQFAKAQTISHKLRNLPVASLKRSILS